MELDSPMEAVKLIMERMGVREEEMKDLIGMWLNDGDDYD